MNKKLSLRISVCSAFLALTCGVAVAREQTNFLKRNRRHFPCEAVGNSEVVVKCIYRESAHAGAGKPEIALDKAQIRFDTKGDGHMRLELTFRNLGRIAVVENRAVYIEFDDNAGRNYIRRQLPGVDFRKLAPGETMTFKDSLLAPALQPGQYFVRLWIPSPDPKLRFDATHNLLLCNSGIPERATGLNILAEIIVKE